MLQVLQAVRTQIPQAQPFRQVMLHQVSRGLREQHLTAMPGAHDARGAMDVQAEIAISGKLGFTRMQPHAHTHAHPIGPGMQSKSALGIDGRRESIARTSESYNIGVPLRTHIMSMPLVEARLQQAPALREDIVSEEQRDGSRW